MIVRQETLDRDVSISSITNEFWSISPLARIHDYVCNHECEILDYLENGSNKIYLLQSLLTENEAIILNNKYEMQDKSVKDLLEIISIRKKAYNSKVYDIIKNLTGEDATIALRGIKDNEINELYDLAASLNVSPELIAVASYIATYNKTSKQNEGLTYAWLLFDELLSVFSRGNKKFELFRLPSTVDSAFIKDKVLYVNDSKYININAEDCDNVVIQIINNRPYALIHKISDNVVNARKNIVVDSSKVYNIWTNGFKYHLTEVEDAKAEWKSIVKDNGFVFDIVMDNTNRAVLSINGRSISALMPGASFDLIGKKVKVCNKPSVNPIKETAATITNIEVIVIASV